MMHSMGGFSTGQAHAAFWCCKYAAPREVRYATPMRSIFSAKLVNGVWGDPGMLIDLKFSRRALLFDLGDLTALPTRILPRVSDVFVSHTHMDHFAGFDHLLRVCLGRDTGVTLYGPYGFIDRVHHKLAAYTWDLVHQQPANFVIEAKDLHADGRVLSARFSTKTSFEREPLDDMLVTDGLLLDDEQFTVRARPLRHHDLVSLAFAFEERTHINVWKNRLDERKLPSGPWLTELKKLARSGAPDDTPVVIRWRTREGSREETLPLGDLKREVLEFVPGQKVCYVTDASSGPDNVARIVEFVRDADILFIEAVFLDADLELASKKSHLATTQSGAIARAANVRHAEPFHFSARYYPEEQRQRDEFNSAWRG
jgi:ribonuclease Z